MESLIGLTLEGKGQEFSGEDFRDLLRPGVYVFALGAQALYVGASRGLIERAAGAHHHQRRAVSGADKVYLFPCATWKDALKLEAELIARLRPSINGRRPVRDVARKTAANMGLSVRRVQEKY